MIYSKKSIWDENELGNSAKRLMDNTMKGIFNIVHDNYIIFSHGTKCAGVIAGKRDGECRNGDGIAYNVQLAGKYKTGNTYIQ